ncbi:unnamed protein product [Arctia plantaginis]|uniref:Uncharacterized protein n=1 Tax=Arctia plantaginis TaxID=874455 RepID=A0A8S0ZJ16_ARCPL|nr:unnamed protein product [Arctia plantaginis]
MDDTFHNLQMESKNHIENLVKWFQDSKLVEKSEEGERHARALFNNPTEEEMVEFEQFKEAVAKLAEEQKTSFDEISKILAEEGPKLVEAINAGLMAFKGSTESKNEIVCECYGSIDDKPSNLDEDIA